jgi:thiol-disulfide isomerase/thioredoxin
MKFRYCLAAWLWPLLSATQQPLSVGDRMPQIKVGNIINYPVSKIQLSSLQDKLVIIDFFATWCTACIKSLPKLDSLQQQFGGKLQVLIVTSESPGKIEAFKKKNKLFARCSLPIVAGDTVFKKLFPHLLLPHEVWIDANGLINAITSDKEITAANISAMIAGAPLHLPLKKDRLDFDSRKPLLQDGNGGDENDLLYRSVWAGRLQGMSTREGRVSERNATRYFYINTPVLSLYKKVLGFASNRVILEVQDPARYILPSGASEEWLDSNLYTYELTVPAQTNKKQLQALFLNDLNRYLHLSGSMELRQMKCWAVVNTRSNDAAFITKGLQPNLTYVDTSASWLFISQPMSEIVASFNDLNTPAPDQLIILDETGFTGNADMEIPAAAMHNLILLHIVLRRYGLSLVPVEREIEMLVLKEQ